eukprot:TRINITY_DN11629_c2_g1_i1.p1 TRINITY_DN11629_c2_g1~~TRINITY_DN11629_c2_g1_i1.p1  ORF type:complete len:598 (+),score=163.62 TRINITY_DN11629_c2_g1_i1:98-1795(+)
MGDGESLEDIVREEAALRKQWEEEDEGIGEAMRELLMQSAERVEALADIATRKAAYLERAVQAAAQRVAAGGKRPAEEAAEVPQAKRARAAAPAPAPAPVPAPAPAPAAPAAATPAPAPAAAAPAPAPAPAAATGAAAEHGIEVGNKVVAHSLLQAADFNGMVGTVAEVREAQNRAVITFAHGRRVGVRLVNLRPATEDDIAASDARAEKEEPSREGVQSPGDITDGAEVIDDGGWSFRGRQTPKPVPHVTKPVPVRAAPMGRGAAYTAAPRPQPAPVPAPRPVPQPYRPQPPSKPPAPSKPPPPVKPPPPTTAPPRGPPMAHVKTAPRPYPATPAAAAATAAAAHFAQPQPTLFQQQSAAQAAAVARLQQVRQQQAAEARQKQAAEAAAARQQQAAEAVKAAQLAAQAEAAQRRAAAAVAAAEAATAAARAAAAGRSRPLPAAASTLPTPLRPAAPPVVPVRPAAGRGAAPAAAHGGKATVQPVVRLTATAARSGQAAAPAAAGRGLPVPTVRPATAAPKPRADKGPPPQPAGRAAARTTVHVQAIPTGGGRGSAPVKVQARRR